MTNYWGHFSPEKEIAQGTNIAKAAKAAGIEHVVWFSSEDTRDRIPLDHNRMPTLMGNYQVPHFHSKGEVNRVFANLCVPTTYTFTSFYWNNFVYFAWGLSVARMAYLASHFVWARKN
ncbi:MAG: NmrA family NAD(P)-binding protein [Cyclobacteriaceae bacterium]|nr:NmrA family NAD(P)-binding protein [Cyclobacteriaceae bacterium]